MNQKVPVSFVIILAVAFAALLFFYFKATVDRYSIRVQNEVQSELLDVYYDILKNPKAPPASLDVFREKYGELEPIERYLDQIDSYFQSKESQLE